MQRRTAIAWVEPRRYGARPWHPAERPPELDFLPADTDADNAVYGGVRALLAALGYDAARAGTPAWSPLSDLVEPGGKVVLKPNYVRHYHESGGDFAAVVTHAAVLRPLVDYAWKAVGPEGQVVIADAPQYDCDVDALLAATELPAFLAWYESATGRRTEWRDLRVQFGRHEKGVVVERRSLAGDPEGYEAVDLGDASEFASMAAAEVALLRGADYDEEVTIRHHSNGRNEYKVARTVLGADLVINLPKIKTHKKTGVTLSMKNLIGINGDKNWLPHYRAGFAVGGGDEFPSPDMYARLRRMGGEMARRMLKRGIGSSMFRRLRTIEDASGLGARARNGNWFGNDTIWRTTIDLNKIFYCGDAQGRVSPPGSELGGTPARRVLNVYDGVVAGEGDGPMAPAPRAEGMLVASEDGVAADVAIAHLMGFDWRRIPVLAHAIGTLAGGVRITDFDGDARHLPIAWIENGARRDTTLAEIDRNLGFEAHPGWKGHIERPSSPDTQSRTGRVACAS